MHHGQVVKAFLSAGVAKRLQLERLPGYVPDLNPDAGIWNYLKRVELGNVCVTVCGAQRSMSATSPTSSAPAHDSAGTCVSSWRRDQEMQLLHSLLGARSIP
jgi:hypothetical protein